MKGPARICPPRPRTGYKDTVPHVPGARRYREISILTATPGQLTIVLHDGAIAALREAAAHVATGDVGQRTRAVRRALAILAELQGALDFGADAELAESLTRQYVYMAQRVFEGNLSQRAEPLVEVAELLETLRDGWVDAVNPPRDG